MLKVVTTISSSSVPVTMLFQNVVFTPCSTYTSIELCDIHLCAKVSVISFITVENCDLIQCYQEGSIIVHKRNVVIANLFFILV